MITCETSANGNSKRTMCTEEQAKQFEALREQGMSVAEAAVEMGWPGGHLYYNYKNQFKPKVEREDNNAGNKHFGKAEEYEAKVRRAIPTYDELAERVVLLERKLIDFVLSSDLR